MQSVGNAHPGTSRTIGERVGSVLYRILLAVAIWAALGWCIGKLVDLIDPQPTTEVGKVEFPPAP